MSVEKLVSQWSQYFSSSKFISDSLHLRAPHKLQVVYSFILTRCDADFSCDEENVLTC